jgi:hypothetical protein
VDYIGFLAIQGLWESFWNERILGIVDVGIDFLALVFGLLIGGATLRI